MNFSLTLSCRPALRLSFRNRALSNERRAYKQKALEAFKKNSAKGQIFYTCNVARLKSCDYLGTKQQIAEWRTSLLLWSKLFEDDGVIVFNARPGEELADSVKMAGFNSLYLALTPAEIINAGDGPGQHPTQALVDLFTIYQERREEGSDACILKIEYPIFQDPVL